MKKLLSLGLAGVVCFSMVACGEDPIPQKIGTFEPEETEEPEETGPIVFHVGDIVELDGINITFLGVSESNGNSIFSPEDGNVFVTLEFEIDNQRDEEITVSSLLSFDAYFDDYSTSTSMGATIDSDKSQLDGTVAPGKKISGIVGYEVQKDWSKAEIRFTPGLFSRDEIVFEYEK